MDEQIKFPHPADVIAEDAERFRRLTAEERVREVVDMAEVANRLLAASPRRAAILLQIEADERAWQDAHRRVFERHGH
jgi:hypothetical protein